MEEIWKPVVGWEDRYEVSNMGRVKSMNYLNHGSTQLLKLCKNTNGYLYVNIFKDGGKKRNYIGVHRLVALTFIPNPEHNPCVNHKDGNKHNNYIDNLEWCTYSENAYHKCRVLGFKSVYQTNHPNKGRFGSLNIRSKCILQYNLEGEFIKEWGSTMDIERELGIKHYNISYCCKLKSKTAGGFVWKYKSP